MAGSPTPSKFDSQDVTVGELLTAHLTTALSQVTTEQELREREAELEAQNERLEQFASMVSHTIYAIRYQLRPETWNYIGKPVRNPV